MEAANPLEQFILWLMQVTGLEPHLLAVAAIFLIYLAVAATWFLEYRRAKPAYISEELLSHLDNTLTNFARKLQDLIKRLEDLPANSKEVVENENSEEIEETSESRDVFEEVLTRIREAQKKAGRDHEG